MKTEIYKKPVLVFITIGRGSEQEKLSLDMSTLDFNAVGNIDKTLKIVAEIHQKNLSGNHT